MGSSEHFKVGLVLSGLAVCYGMKGNICQKCLLFLITYKLPAPWKGEGNKPRASNQFLFPRKFSSNFHAAGT